MKGFIYEGLGNSFIILNEQENINYHILSNRLSNMYNTDGLITYSKINNKMRIYNKDGSLASMCGNGLRCLIEYIYTKLSCKTITSINTDDGKKDIEIISLNPFISKINLGKPKLIEELKEIKSIKINNHNFVINPIFLSTYHIVIFTKKINKDEINEYIEQIYHYPNFKNKCNITFFEIINYKTIKSLTYERGVGFTKSCATGASASAYIAYLLHNLSSNIKVIQEEGELEVIINADIFLTGPSSFVKEINYDE